MMTQKLKILHIEDTPTDAELVDRQLKKSGVNFETLIVDTRAEYASALEEFRPDVILSDHSLPAFNSLDALKILQQTGKKIPFILITSTVSEEFAVSVMKEGATDYILKDRLQRLPNAVINALDKFQSDNDRQNYHNKIVASEALFTKAESIAEFGTWRFHIATKNMSWSAGTYPLLGFAANEVESSLTNFLKNIFPDDAKYVQKSFDDAGHERSGEMDFRINYRGQKHYIHSQFEVEVNGDGSPEYLIGFNQDVTRSQLAQLEIQKNVEELKAAAERQSAILNALPPHIVLLNEAGKIVAINESWRKFTIENNLGIPKYGVDYSYVAISEKATGVDEQSGRRIAKGIKDVILGAIKEFSLEYSSFKKKNKVWFQIIVAPLADKTRKGAVVLHIDITARKTAEELMLQSEANLKTTVENTDIAYILCNAENKIISFNTKAEELCSELFNKKIKIGVNAFNYFLKNKVPNVKKAAQKVLENEMVSYEASYDVKHGCAKWYEVRWAGVAGSKNENIGSVIAFKDITGRKIDELEREQMTSDLLQRNKDLEQFTYIVSHNLRAPVANILGLSNILDINGLDIEVHNEVKKSLSTSVSILDHVITDLNNILQVRSEINGQTEFVPFGVLVEDIYLSLNNIIQSEKASINSNFDEATGITTIKAYMHSIFYNLIINAIKYRRPEVNPVISISTKKTGDRLKILFKDNGKGIEEKNLENLFGIYKRFDTETEGKGMGLFMVKMQVESLGGKISVQSKPGIGTTFILEFPDYRFAI
jgi:PAS domain S-box-containing protein